MIRALVAGLGFGAAVQAFRNWPPDGPLSADLAVWLFVVGLGLAFVAGRARRQPAAVAVAHAEAHAESVSSATNSVNVLLVSGDHPPATSPASGLDTAPWLVGGTTPALHALLDSTEVEAVLDDGGLVEDVTG